ncbi:MAG TPA: hypothetical protein VHM89_00360 [Acidimicrobiales bacterium]|nr:hypothetical protein [Acidimicrobiales bacterium]
MSDRRSYGTVKERERASFSLDVGIDETLADVARDGFALARGALPGDERLRLLGEARGAGNRFLRVPARVNGVLQRADQLSVRVGDPTCPAVNGMAARLRRQLLSADDDHALHGFTATEARFMRYRGDTGGLGPHRDGMCYGLLVAVYSLAGSAEFTVLSDDAGPVIRLLVEAGDLLLLRAPGFDGAPDGRRRHAVGPPLSGGERVSLTLRMVGRCGAARRPDRWSATAG